MTQKKHRISPEGIDLKEIKKKLQLQAYNGERIKYAKNMLKAHKTVCRTCAGWCSTCLAVFPKGKGLEICCPCAVYLKKDVAHVVEYLLLNLKI